MWLIRFIDIILQLCAIVYIMVQTKYKYITVEIGCMFENNNNMQRKMDRQANPQRIFPKLCTTCFLCNVSSLRELEFVYYLCSNSKSLWRIAQNLVGLIRRLINVRVHFCSKNIMKTMRKRYYHYIIAQISHSIAM